MLDFTQLCSSTHSSVQAHTALFEHIKVIRRWDSKTHSHSSVRAHTALFEHQHTHTVLFKHISTHSSDRAHQHRIPLLLGTVFGVAASGIVVSYAVAPGIGPAKRFKCRFTSSLITVARQRGVHEAFMSTQLGS